MRLARVEHSAKSAWVNLGTRGKLTLQLDPALYRRDVHIRGLGAKGDEGTYTSEDKAETDGGKVTSELSISMSDLTGLGLYRLTMTPHRGEPEVRLVARTAPSEEGRMQRMNKEGWTRNYPKELLEDRVIIREQGSSGGSGSETGEGEIWRMLARIPFGTENPRAAFKKLVTRGGFVPRLRVGNRWFFKKDDVHRYIENFTHAGTPEEEERTFQDIVDEANELALGRPRR